MTNPAVPALSEKHSLNRERRFHAGSLYAVVSVLQSLHDEAFTGRVSIEMGQGGFGEMSTEETIKLVRKEDVA